MDDHKKLEFVHKMAKLGLQHFAGGGTGGLPSGSTTGADPVNGAVGNMAGNAVGGGSTGATVNGLVNPLGSAIGNNTILNPISDINTAGNVLSGATQQGTPGTQNPYVQSNATNPNTGIMGSIGGALGLNDNFQASSANVTPGTNAAQLGTAYTGAQNALAGQQNLANTLQPQATNAVANQNALANQYAAMAQGQGPNPALNQLAQATGANVSNQAALMAGQRGSGANAGLLARQNAQQGAATQQQAAGQAATQQAQQQINAQNNLANLSNAQIGQAGQAATNLSSATQGEQGILQNANTGFNNAIVGMQSNINNVNSQTAAANQNMSSNILGGIGSMAQSGGGLSSMFAEGGDVGQDTSSLGSSTADQSADSQGTFTASSDSAQGPSIPGTSTLPANSTDLGKDMSSSSGGGGGGGGGGGLMSLMALAADGGTMGTFNPYTEGASSGPNIPATGTLPANTTDFAKDLKSMKKDSPKSQSPVTNQSAVPGGGLMADNSSTYSAGPQPGQMYAARGGTLARGPHKSHVANYLFGGGNPKNMTGGGPVKASNGTQKAVKPGNSYDNDKIPAMLSDGEVVIDRNTLADKGPIGQMARTIQAHLAKRNGKK